MQRRSKMKVAQLQARWDTARATVTTNSPLISSRMDIDPFESLQWGRSLSCAGSPGRY